MEGAVEIVYRDIRVGMRLGVSQEFSDRGPQVAFTRYYRGKVVEVSQKWLRMAGPDGIEIVIPQQPAAIERFWRPAK